MTEKPAALWRVRTTLPDRPGALAVLAQRCGAQGINILGLQIFPGIGAVTDELVLQTPGAWDAEQIAGLLGSSGALAVSSARCTEAALTDQPTRYVQAARSILAQPASFPEVVARLFDAEAEPTVGSGGGVVVEQDVMEMNVADVLVQVHRTAPFTATEHARGWAMAELVSDVLVQDRRQAPAGVPERTPGGESPEFVVSGDRVRALVAGQPVGEAAVGAPVDDEDTRPITLSVDPGWRRCGVGTRLLLDAARIAQGLGAGEIVLTTGADNHAVLPMVLSAGLRGRIRLAGDVLTVRMNVRQLRPLQV